MVNDENLEIEFEFPVNDITDVSVRVMGFFDHINDLVPIRDHEKKIFLTAMVCANMEYERDGENITAHYDLDDWNMMCLYNDIVEFMIHDIVPEFDNYPERYRKHNIAEFQDFLNDKHKYLKYE
jgi:hypothetical protein